MENYKILAINPGSTSTKISVFHNNTEVHREDILHDHEELKKYENVIEQEDFRYDSITSSLEKGGHNLLDFSIVMSRGGMLRPMAAGIYEINEIMLEDFRNAIGGEHGSNVGAFIANKIKVEKGIPAYIVDPITVDEMTPVARVSGFKGIERKSLSHALNIRRVAFLCADKLNKNLNELNFIIAHLGGGISIAAMKQGKLIDVENANSLGAFSPERCGGLPFSEVIDLLDSGEYSSKELKRKLLTEGGIYSYLNTKDIREVEQRIKSGEEEARLILDAFIYQISKGIGEMATVLKGNVDKIIITGGIAYSDYVFEGLSENTSFISSIERFPGEAEMLGLAESAIRLLEKREIAKEYGEVVESV